MKNILILSFIAFSFIAKADVFEDNEIDVTLPLKDFVQAVHTYVNDNNITTGTSTITYEKTRGVKDLEKFAEELLAKEMQPEKINGRPTTRSLRDHEVIEIAYDLAIGNALTLDKCPLSKAKANPNDGQCKNLEELIPVVAKVVDKMGNIRNLEFIKSKTTMVRFDTKREVVLTLIYNSRNREAVWFYTVEGTI